MTIRFICSLIAVSVLSATALSQDNPANDKKTDAVVPSPWKSIDVDTKASLRGLHVYSATEIWASGTGGTIIHSTDGGETWRVKIVPGAEELDFRDIHAIDESTIVAITSGTPARIYRTSDGGSNWKICDENKHESVFLDSLSFWDDQKGLVMGDPINNHLFLLGTNDGGKTWRLIPNAPTTSPGEAGFAASGTNMITIGDRKVMIALGSDIEGSSKKSSRILISEDNGQNWTAASVPLGRSQSGGIFSICFANDNDGVAVGGDYQNPQDTSDNYATTNDGGKTWTIPERREPPSGYRSCVAMWVNGGDPHLIAVGPDGTDLSSDLGKHWSRVSNVGFHSIDFTADGQHGWASGSDGRVAKWIGIAGKAPTKDSERARVPSLPPRKIK